MNKDFPASDLGSALWTPRLPRKELVLTHHISSRCTPNLERREKTQQLPHSAHVQSHGSSPTRKHHATPSRITLLSRINSDKEWRTKRKTISWQEFEERTVHACLNQAIASELKTYHSCLRLSRIAGASNPGLSHSDWELSLFSLAARNPFKLEMLGDGKYRLLCAKDMLHH